MKPLVEIVSWARNQTKQLHLDMEWVKYASGGGFWRATKPEALTEIIARATAALEFLRQYAGQDSQSIKQATAIYENKGGNQSIETGARAVGDILSEWASQIESGLIEIHGVLASEIRKVASIDLMSQVHELVEDKTVHPAAPIVLAGAALEIALRAAVEERQLVLTDRPSIATYGQALRSAGLVTNQGMKELAHIGGLRNSAAHGDFKELRPEQAGVMESMVNVFLAKLTETLDGPVPES